MLNLKNHLVFDYVNLQKNALCVISDSGTICEESAIMGFPAITFRNSMERPEALDAGSIIITGFDIDIIMTSIDIIINQINDDHTEKVYPMTILSKIRLGVYSI